LITIISNERNELGFYTIETQSHRTECWEDGYIAVPEHLSDVAWACMGYCDLVIEDGVLVDIIPTERPAEPGPLPDPEPTADELMNILLGVQS